MTIKNPVYTDAEIIRIEAHHNRPNTFYLVCYGYVDWARNGTDLVPAVYVLMEYSEVRGTVPPHLVAMKNDDGTSDFEKVLEAMSQLKQKYNL